MEAVVIEKEALRLPENERARLADRLLESLSRRPAELEAAWLLEADSRMTAFREGLIEAVAGPEAMAKLRLRTSNESLAFLTDDDHHQPPM
ncbi:MAG: addiction module protein [Luteolibacter sp.]